MTVDIPGGPDDPAQDQVRDWFSSLGSGPWLPLVVSRREDDLDVGTYCALAPTSYRSDALGDPAWDLLHGSHGPSFMQEWDESGASVATYLRSGAEPLEPLVVEREFHGAIPNYRELSEEFRLYHNLYHELGSGRLLKMDEVGNFEVAAHVEPDRVLVLTPLVRQFQAAKQMDLLLFIDSLVHFDSGTSAPPDMDWTTAELRATRYSGDSSLGAPFTRFLATRVIPAPPVDQSGVWPYEVEDDHYPEFIIGADDLGKLETFTCNPKKLANFFGANPDAPNYLTAVQFRRDVLVKYYDRPDLYTVEDGYLRAAGLWGLRLDNDSPDKVSVWLGDLGRDLPAPERDYWKSYNVAPTGSISPTAFRRAILGQFADAQSVDLRFRVAYRDIATAWPDRFGWRLFRDSDPEDAYLLDSVRRPLHDTEAEFEELVRTLAKLLIDALNESELARSLPPGPEGEKGIGKLERWLREGGYTKAAEDAAFLRNIQAVRSTGAAHLKGSSYQKTLDRVFGPKRRSDAGNDLLVRSVILLRDLTAFAAQPPGDESVEAARD